MPQLPLPAWALRPDDIFLWSVDEAFNCSQHTDAFADGAGSWMAEHGNQPLRCGSPRPPPPRPPPVGPPDLDLFELPALLRHLLYSGLALLLAGGVLVLGQRHAPGPHPMGPAAYELPPFNEAADQRNNQPMMRWRRRRKLSYTVIRVYPLMGFFSWITELPGAIRNTVRRNHRRRCQVGSTFEGRNGEM